MVGVGLSRGGEWALWAALALAHNLVNCSVAAGLPTVFRVKSDSQMLSGKLRQRDELCSTSVPDVAVKQSLLVKK